MSDAPSAPRPNGGQVHGHGFDIVGALRAFVRVVESGSFTAVARELGLSQPAVSRQIATLEDHLGARLLHRTTRSLSLTDDGRDLLEHAARVLEAVEETEAAIGGRRGNPAGLVRIGAPVTFGRMHVAPGIAALLDRYKDLRIELSLTDRIIDLVPAGLDVAFRIGAVPDSALVARKVGQTARICAASTSYIAQRGEPKHPDDLKSHDCVIFIRAGGTTWHFQGPDGPCDVSVAGRFTTDSGEGVLQAVRAGLGVGIMPAWLVRDALAAGEVRALLTDWQPPLAPIHALYPSRRYLASRTRAVIDHFAERFRQDPVLAS